MIEIDGMCDEKFGVLRPLLADLIERGEDVGASIALTIDGKPLVDLWGGWADEAKTLPWQRDTITNVWSTTKTMTALCALILIDRGLIHEDDPVAKHWPEFAAEGKEHITLGNLMSHTSGVSGWDQPVTAADMYDWDRSTSMLAAQAPWWEAGTASGYHAINYGHLIGEVIRRVTGKKLGEFFADEVASPLGADFQIGTKESDFSRIADVIPPPPLEIPDGTPMDSVVVKTFTGPPVDATWALTAQWRAADIGGANGHGNARSVARVQSVITNGGTVDGVRLLSPETIQRIFRRYSDGTDLVLGVPLTFGLGFCLGSPVVPEIPIDSVAFWGGWGGSIIVNDIGRGLTFAYMMNNMRPGLIGSPSSREITEAIYAAVG